MMVMARLIQSGRAASDIMELVRAEDARRGPDTLCTCGSGRKLAACHGTALD
jgi:hypothetical protein